MSEEKHYPFHCGTQALDWQMSNCERCKKFEPNKYQDSGCDIVDALNRAFFEDGSVTEEIAKRMGAIENKFALVWMCPEVEWTEEWKTEYLAKEGSEV